MTKSILIYFLFVTSLAIGQIPEVNLIDDLFSKYNNATPGVAVGIELDGTRVYEKAFGLADLEHNVPNTTETIFESGSVAKQFTAMCIQLLAADGKLSLSDDIRKYVPEIPQYTTLITIQHLLNHTSGLKDWGSIGALSGWPRTTRVYTLELALQIMARQTSTNFPPGSMYSYSNSNYSLLVIIVERVSGQTLAAFTSNRLFKPLQMDHTQWRDNFREVVRDRAIAYQRVGDNYEQLMPFENVHGHGGLLTTISDLLKWNQLLATHAIGGDKVFESRTERGKLTDGSHIAYASGLRVEKLGDNLEIAHSGATAGYRAWLAYYPDRKLSIVLLSNDSKFNPSAVGREVAAIFLGKQNPADDQQDSTNIIVSKVHLQRYVGTYRSEQDVSVKTLVIGNGAVNVNGTTLVTLHKDTLALNSGRWIYVKPGVLHFNDGDGLMVYKKVEPSSSNNAIDGGGTYVSVEADASYQVEFRNDTLWVANKPFAPMPLQPSFKDAYTSKDGDLYEFKRDKRGKVNGFYLSTSRAGNVLFNRVY